MKNTLETLFARNVAPPAQAEFMRIFGILPNFDLISGDRITDEFLSRGTTDFHAALNYVWRLPYGRNSNRADFNSVLKERCGTCSTKHALLAALAAEQKRKIFLNLGIYEMNVRNTPSVGEALDEFGLKSLPEAHCYLTYMNERIDITRFSSTDEIEPNKTFLYEERIQPDQIGDYKIGLHRAFFQNWMCGKKLSRKFDFEELWNVRERCIAALTQDIV